MSIRLLEWAKGCVIIEQAKQTKENRAFLRPRTVQALRRFRAWKTIKQACLPDDGSGYVKIEYRGHEIRLWAGKAGSIGFTTSFASNAEPDPWSAIVAAAESIDNYYAFRGRMS